MTNHTLITDDTVPPDNDPTAAATAAAATPADSARGDLPRRPIRSFVLREGRLTAAQARAFDRLWPRLGVDLPATGVLDLPALFGNAQPVVLEIGFGNGEALAAMAAAAPARNFLGVEVHRPGVGHLLLELDRLELTNVRLLRTDATLLLAQGLAAHSLDAVHLFFPDPWPKARHHKRRIVQPPFLAALARVLRPGGHFHAATDWAPYAAHMQALFEADAQRFINVAGPGAFSPRPPHRPATRFERRGERLGHQVFDLLYQRV